MLVTPLGGTVPQPLGVGDSPTFVGLQLTGNLNLNSAAGKIQINGKDVFQSPDTVANNCFVGKQAALFMTDGTDNTAVGVYAGFRLSTGLNNVFLGTRAGYNTSGGIDNVIVGAFAGREGSASYNVYIGKNAGFTGGGNNNVIIGADAGYSINTGINNTFVGSDAGYSINSGGHNVGCGMYAGNGITTGSFNTFIGQSAQPDTGQGGNSSSIGIGYGAKTTASNQCVIGSNIVDGNIDSIYLGQGVAKASPGGIVVQATGGSGTDNAGGDFTLAGGKGTGTGVGGNVIIQTAPAAGASGSSLNAPVDRVVVTDDGYVSQSTPDAAPTDADLLAGSISFYLDEAGNNLKVRVKYANGTTYKTGTLAIV